MKLYLVIGRDYDEVEYDDEIYGVFSTKERAQEIADETSRNFIDHNEHTVVEILDLVVDEPTEVYHHYKNN